MQHARDGLLHTVAHYEPGLRPLELRHRRGGSSARKASSRGMPRSRALSLTSFEDSRISSIPSTIAFEIALFPHNVPLPSPKTSARIVGGLMHTVHLCVRVSQVRKIRDSDLGWEDMYREGEGDSWFDWVSLTPALCPDYTHSQVAPDNSPLVRSCRRLFSQRHLPLYTHKNLPSSSAL